jgi:2-dehydropantoate 2-reductase
MQDDHLRIVILGAGAMGSAIGGLLHEAGHSVTLVDVWEKAVETINRDGLRIDDKAGAAKITRPRAVLRAEDAGETDLVIVFVKCYHTEAAVRAALPILGPKTVVLSLQNGWGNGARIGAIAGTERLLLGVCYHSATLLGPGHVLHGGRGPTFLGELNGAMTDRLKQISSAFNKAGFTNTATADIVREIWAKLSLNVVTLPTSATIRITADQLLITPELQATMQDLLRETAAVAAAEKITLDFDERWTAISGLLKGLAAGVKGSMLQDVEAGRKTEIDVINGAIVAAGLRHGIPTPVNQAMVALIKAREATLPAPKI